MIPATNIERIISFGGGVSVDANDYSALNLERFALFASKSGATLIIRKAQNLTSLGLERIAAFGKGKVIFDFDQKVN